MSYKEYHKLSETEKEQFNEEARKQNLQYLNSFSNGASTMETITRHFNIPRSKEGCEQTNCVECEYMREKLMGYTRYHECFDSVKSMRFVVQLHLRRAGAQINDIEN